MSESTDAAVDSPAALNSRGPATWLAPAVIALTLVIAGTAALVGIALGQQGERDDVRALCTALARTDARVSYAGSEKHEKSLIVLDIDHEGSSTWVCRGATRTPLDNGSVTVAGFRYVVTRVDGGEFSVDLG